MALRYDVFVGAFLSKISDFDFAEIDDMSKSEMVDGYLKRALVAFKKNCKYDLSSSADDAVREFNIDIAPEDVDELVDIISEGMVLQWLKPYLYQQELLQNQMNTRDLTMYSPAELLMRVGNAYNQTHKDYIQMIREYSYNHGDLTELHI